MQDTNPFNPLPNPLTGATSWKNYYYADGERVAMREWGSAVTSENGVVYFINDHLGSATVRVKADGTKAGEALYKPWGETRYQQGGAPTTDYGFTGQRLSGYTGLYFYQARWYNPLTGRFMSPDTIVPEGQGVQAWDRYAYVNNSPVRYNDPTGHDVGCAGKDAASCKTVILILGGCAGDSKAGGPPPETQMYPYKDLGIMIRYRGSSNFINPNSSVTTDGKIIQAKDALAVVTEDHTLIIIGYSSGADAALMAANDFKGKVKVVILLGPTFSGETPDGGSLEENYQVMIDKLLENDVRILLVKDSSGFKTDISANLEEWEKYSNFTYWDRSEQKHYDGGTAYYQGEGTNNSDAFRDQVIDWLYQPYWLNQPY